MARTHSGAATGCSPSQRSGRRRRRSQARLVEACGANSCTDDAMARRVVSFFFPLSFSFSFSFSVFLSLSYTLSPSLSLSLSVSRMRSRLLEALFDVACTHAQGDLCQKKKRKEKKPLLYCTRRKDRARDSGQVLKLEVVLWARWEGAAQALVHNCCFFF